MHRGNVLVKRTKEEFIYFRLNDKDYHIKSYGVVATIVDFTLSRITQKGLYQSHTEMYQNKEKGKGMVKPCFIHIQKREREGVGGGRSHTLCMKCTRIRKREVLVIRKRGRRRESEGRNCPQPLLSGPLLHIDN